MCDLLVTHGPYLNALEINVGHYRVLYKFTFFYSYDQFLQATWAGTVFRCLGFSARFLPLHAHTIKTQQSNSPQPSNTHQSDKLRKESDYGR